MAKKETWYKYMKIHHYMRSHQFYFHKIHNTKK